MSDPNDFCVDCGNKSSRRRFMTRIGSIGLVAGLASTLGIENVLKRWQDAPGREPTDAEIETLLNDSEHWLDESAPQDLRDAFARNDANYMRTHFTVKEPPAGSAEACVPGGCYFGYQCRVSNGSCTNWGNRRSWSQRCCYYPNCTVFCYAWAPGNCGC